MTDIQDSRCTLTEAKLAQFTGSLTRYRHLLHPQVFYTPGVQHVAEAGKACWLIDAIVSYFGSRQMHEAMEQDSRLQIQQFWRLEVDGSSAVLTASADSDVEPFVQQPIPFTDFPLASLDIWAGYDGSCWTLYLPSEH